MRRDNDWLEKLTTAYELSMNVVDKRFQDKFLAALSTLEEILDGKGPPRAFDSASGLYGFISWVSPLKPETRQRAERLAERLWQAKGSGRTFAEESLLGQVGVQASPGSLPFFRAAVEANRPRDSFQVRRRQIAVASVAFIFLQTRDPAAHAQLEAWLAHPDVAVRAEAAFVYGRLHLTRAGRLEPEALAVLERVAYQDRAFAPRFLARGWLHKADVPLRVEPPDGIYAFRVSLGRVSRTVELKATDDLFHLASFILDAFGWDHDHLYEFALTDDVRDRRFVVPDIEDASPALGPDSDVPDSLRIPLGALGLSKGHKFLFRYDFGDAHRFRVTVAEFLESQRPGETYPRVAASSGEAPEQYPLYD